jgi:hypothetical protein
LKQLSDDLAFELPRYWLNAIGRSIRGYMQVKSDQTLFNPATVMISIFPGEPLGLVSRLKARNKKGNCGKKMEIAIVSIFQQRSKVHWQHQPVHRRTT